MDITVTGRRMNVSDALRDYAEEKDRQFDESDGYRTAFRRSRSAS